MYRSQFPRLYELKDQLPQTGNPAHLYFQDFEKTLEVNVSAQNAFQVLERELEELDYKAWELLKNETVSLLSNKHPERNWQQLFNKLNEAKGYKLLSELGCKQIKFIPISKIKGIETPDLEGILCDSVILCEVKTINISDDEIFTRKKFIARDVNYDLSKSFFNQFDSALIKAESQLLSYRKGDSSRRIAYFTIHFDEPLSLNFDCCRTEYRRQLADHIKKKKSGGIEIKIHDLIH